MVTPVLLLEDDIDLSTMFAEFLEQNGCSVLAVHSVPTMIDHRSEVADCQLTFLDIDLGPGELTGIDAYNWLKQQKLGGRVYFLTAHGQRHPLVAQAKAIGAVEVMSKPVSPSTLLQTLQDCAV